MDAIIGNAATTKATALDVMTSAEIGKVCIRTMR